jgi:glycosyltransferase involved in cell wall biosynthesis
MGHLRRKFSAINPIHRVTYLHPRLAAVCCNCHAAAEPLARAGVPRERLFTIYPGHPCHDAAPPPDYRVRRELGLPAGALVVGFAGNMRPVKGVDVLLNAALQLKHEHDIHWLLLGRVEDPEVERLAGHPDIRDRVHCLGWRDDARRLFAAMDVFAMPSRSEGLSRSIMEAMELGLCPVATRVGGTPELVRDLVDGLVVSPDDAWALASAIRLLALHPSLRRSLANSARQRIRAAFTVERMVDQTMAMYDAMLGGREQADDDGADESPVILPFPQRGDAPARRAAA